MVEKLEKKEINTTEDSWTKENGEEWRKSTNYVWTLTGFLMLSENEELNFMATWFELIQSDKQRKHLNIFIKASRQLFMEVKKYLA